ncbi:MAG: DUF58 domain-containing protein [Acidimicrobiia bacterium]|nr:DUF58 domain-containing protein [Acidimicrobiia bacterium]
MARPQPTRQGWTVLAGAVTAVVVGRTFGVIELYVIGAALGIAAVIAVVAVALRRPRVTVHRWIRPSVLTAGDVGRVEVVATAERRSPSFELVEPVGPDRTARMFVAPLREAEQVSAGYRIPTERRGVLTVGPLTAVRHDVVGLARTVTEVAGPEQVLVSPRAYLLEMPELGQGVLGRHLLALARRLGPGDFHSLRDYVDGDEPRTIHWRASARSEELKVRQHSVEGLRRCVVLLDQHVGSTEAEVEGFERAVTAAASVVHSADRAGLTTRFVTTDGADLRGPDVAATTLHLLAHVARSTRPTVPVDRDPGEGLGLVVVITPRGSSAPWAALERVGDPTLTSLGVFTMEAPSRHVGLLTVDARSEPDFLTGWELLAGVGRLDARARDPLRRDVTVPETVGAHP